MFRLTFFLLFLEWGKSEASWNTLCFLGVPSTNLVHTDISALSAYSNTPPSLSSIAGAIEKAPSVVKLGVHMCDVPSAFAKEIRNAAAIRNQLVKNQHWRGPSNGVHCRPAFPSQRDHWGTAGCVPLLAAAQPPPKDIPSCSALAATQTDRWSNSWVENSVTQADRHMHTQTGTCTFHEHLWIMGR